jgi:rare lipoprotein A (peptidoglycan hydrolase)
MLDHLILMLSLLGAGHVGLGTIFGSSRWDRSNPHSRLACLHREINDQKDFVIAHNELPCGTKVWIFNPRTGLSTTAEVADRGPRHAYADLSKPVAAAIQHNGRENILLVPVSVPPPKKKRHKGDLVVKVAPPVEESWEVPPSAMIEVITPAAALNASRSPSAIPPGTTPVASEDPPL